MSEEEARALAKAEFWDERYKKVDKHEEQPSHEWFRSFEALEPWFKKHLFETRAAGETGPVILHLGSGDSTIPYDLLARGYRHQTCIDFSQVVVDLMIARHTDTLSSVRWLHGDVRDMKAIESNSVDVAFDKGTLDAMIYGSPWSPPDEVMENSGRYMTDVQRVLKDDGVFLYITYRQPHFVKPILNRDNEWEIEMDVLGGGDSFEYFGFVLRKRKKVESS